MQMDRQRAVDILRANADGLRGRGVRHAALFGSIARNEGRAESGVDILVELDPDAAPDVFAYANLRQYVSDMFSRPVDVIDRDCLKPELRESVPGDAVYAF